MPPSQAAIYIRINLAQILTYLHLKNHPNSNLPQDIVELLVEARQQARDILHDMRLESSVNGNLGGLYEKTHQSTEALEYTELAWQEAESLNVNGGDIFYQWAWQKGRLLQKKPEKTKDAIYAYKEAFNALQLLRNDLLGINLDTQFSFRDNVESVYRELVGLLVQYDSSQGELGLTLKQDSNSGIVQLAKIKSDDRKTAIDILQQKFDLSIGVIQSLQLAELENFLQCNLLNVTNKPINQLADDSSAAVFYPIILEDKSEVIVKIPNNPYYHYPVNYTRYELEDNLKNLLEALRTKDKQLDIKKLSSKVYDWLIRPAEPYLIKNQVKYLVFVLDGVLRNIPMSVLYDRVKKEYLIQKYPVAITPGLNILGPKSLPKKQLKVLIGAYSQKPNLPKFKDTTYGFDELKQVLEEAKYIKNLFPGSIELSDRNFTNENLEKALNSDSYSIVHLATHGNFSSDPQQTFIVTASSEPFKVNDFQNILQARVQTNQAPIDLLVFSACQTATGDRRATLGIAGAAIRAGASSTLATLWTVKDNSTTLLMQNFYSYLKNQKMTKAEALRLAQLELLNSKYKEPYYWAPFILVGNWR